MKVVTPGRTAHARVPNQQQHLLSAFRLSYGMTRRHLCSHPARPTQARHSPPRHRRMDDRHVRRRRESPRQRARSARSSTSCRYMESACTSTSGATKRPPGDSLRPAVEDQGLGREHRVLPHVFKSLNRVTAHSSRSGTASWTASAPPRTTSSTRASCSAGNNATAAGSRRPPQAAQPGALDLVLPGHRFRRRRQGLPGVLPRLRLPRARATAPTCRPRDSASPGTHSALLSPSFDEPARRAAGDVDPWHKGWERLTSSISPSSPRTGAARPLFSHSRSMTALNTASQVYGNRLELFPQDAAASSTPQGRLLNPYLAQSLHLGRGPKQRRKRTIDTFCYAFRWTLYIGLILCIAPIYGQPRLPG